ncbi:MAG: alpha-xylosidase, partial [Oscillospiraceae bacterium]|nr:alpha-xylosidase [Oscillospiraceae bacterium]
MSELHERLLAKTDGAANDSNIIIENNVRITVISNILIRIEKGDFTDLPSQTVWYRNSEKTDFKTEKSSNIIRIITDKAEFAVNTKNGKFLYAVIDGQKQKYDRDLNRKGTTRTLDQTFGAVPLKDGILSQNGVTVMDDSKTLLLKSDGKLVSRKKGSSDKYVFAYGKDNIGCLNAFYSITGKAPLIPRFALGNWWSRYRAYTQKEYEDLMDEFIRRDIPLTIATVDMDWHWVNVEEKFNYSGDKGLVWKGGWTGYSWNTDLFPDYKCFLKGLQERNLKVTLNLHPADGVRPFDDMYAEMCKAVGQNENEQKPVAFDLTDSAFINAYFNVLHHPYEQQGVDFWWIDWQQGTKSKKAGLDPLWLLNHYHYLDSGKDGKRPLILSRYAGLGSHSYPVGFSVDTASKWSVRDFQPYF